MRNLEAEKRLVNRLFMFAGFGFLAGLTALAVGTEMLVLTYWDTDPINFWIWQGVWIIFQALTISSLARTFKKG